jgi:DNA-binding response OmpR family regulator
MENVVANQRQKKILVVDDDPGILEAVQTMLEFEGYEVLTTTDWSKLGRMFDEKTGILLLDVLLSGQDGREICKSLKKHNDLNVPIILFSASYDVRQSAREAGADDFIAKPFEMDELIGKIEKHM